MRREFKFTSITRVNRVRPRSRSVYCNVLVKAVRWSTHYHDADSCVMRYEDLYLEVRHGGGGHQLGDLVLVEAFFM